MATVIVIDTIVVIVTPPPSPLPPSAWVAGAAVPSKPPKEFHQQNLHQKLTIQVNQKADQNW
jgi:hypothetical protein